MHGGSGDDRFLVSIGTDTVFGDGGDDRFII